jgi:predicted N-formylglutamate amidohydrolase
LKARPLYIIITCEHGGNRVPEHFSALFRGRKGLLESHRGYDPGALTLAKNLSRGLGAPLYSSTLTRLLVDLNRSPRNPRRFSDITGRLNEAEKTAIEQSFYLPYREKIETVLQHHVRKGRQVLHLSVHTFIPVLNGKLRNTGVGFLYDPLRTAEAAFCLRWQHALCRLYPDLPTRRNYPYKGSSDGFTSYLRKRFPESSYLGIELEVSQKYLSAGHTIGLVLQNSLLETLPPGETARTKGM